MKKNIQYLVALTLLIVNSAMAQTTIKPTGAVSISGAFFRVPGTDSVYVEVAGSPKRYYNLGVYGKTTQQLDDSLVKKLNLADSIKKYVTPTMLNAAIGSAIVPDATTSVKGKIKLAGDLAGTADNPTVPGKTNINGSNATGTWPISITGSSASATIATNSDRIYNQSGYMNLLWADGGTPQWLWGNNTVNGPSTASVFSPASIVAAAGTISNNTMGNAATATNSANWNSILGVFTTPQSETIANPIAIDVNGSAYKYTVGAFRDWLGTPLGGETLASVMDRGNIISNNKQITYKSDLDDILAFNNGAGTFQGYFGKIASAGSLNGMWISNIISGKNLQLRNTGELDYNGHVNVGGRITWGDGSFASSKGQIYNDAGLGTVFAPKAGSTYDWYITDPIGGAILQVPTGTRNVVLPTGSISAPAATIPALNGNVDISGNVSALQGDFGNSTANVRLGNFDANTAYIQSTAGGLNKDLAFYGTDYKFNIGDVTFDKTLVVKGSVTNPQPSSAMMDYTAGKTRFLSYGPDVSTRGGFDFVSLAADGTRAVYPITIDGNTNVALSGNATIAGSVTVDEGLNVTGGDLGVGTYIAKFKNLNGVDKFYINGEGKAVFTENLTTPTATIGSTTIGGGASNVEGTAVELVLRPTSGTAGGRTVFQNDLGTAEFGFIGFTGWNGPAVLTGTPTAPTPTEGTNTTQIATTAFVQNAITNAGVTSGSGTVTVTNVFGVTSSFSGIQHWIRVGNIVTVNGSVGITPSSTGLDCVFRVSIPIPSLFTTDADLRGLSTGPGQISSSDQSIGSGNCVADATNMACAISLKAKATRTVDVSFSYSYVVK